MKHNSGQSRMLVAVDCVIFGFDGQDLKLLLIKQNTGPQKNKWGLMSGWLQPGEDFGEAASRMMYDLTGLEDAYLEQVSAFGAELRQPKENTVAVAYLSLLNINASQLQLNDQYQAQWISLQDLPGLVAGQTRMVEAALERLRYKAAIHPLLFELLPAKFTIPQLQILYEAIYDSIFDKRNFSRKILSTNLLVKQKDKEKLSSKRGAFYYKLNKRRYSATFNAFLHFVADPGNLK